MLVFSGESALSSFQLSACLNQLRGIGVQLNSLTAHYYYFIELVPNQILSKTQTSRLCALLQAQEQQGEESQENQVIVAPRVGTISPWCTKAVDILHHCELSAIKRVERGIVYRIEGVDATLLKDKKLLKVLHDPMLESVFFTQDAVQKLFIEHEPQPLFFVDIIKKANELYSKPMKI